VRGSVQGVQVSAPFGKIEYALDVLQDVLHEVPSRDARG
jgi:hypothetical protein